MPEDVKPDQYQRQTILSPKVPINRAIKPLHHGDIITIHGYVPPDAKRFTVRFDYDLGDGLVETPFMINARFDQRVIVRNCKLGGVWGQDETFGGLATLQKGAEFVLTILVHDVHYRIAINKEHFADFRHRMPYAAAGLFKVQEDIVVNCLTFQAAKGGAVQKPDPLLPLLPNKGEEKDVESAMPHAYDLPVPFTVEVPDGMVNGRTIYMSALVNVSGNRIYIDIQTSSGHLVLHMNPRLDSQETVFNSMINKKWGQEFHHPTFPFKKGEHFDLIIKADQDNLHIFVNNQYYQSWPLKNKAFSASDVKILSINGCLELIFLKMM